MSTIQEATVYLSGLKIQGAGSAGIGADASAGIEGTIALHKQADAQFLQMGEG